MKSIGERVKARRQQLGLSTPQLAKRVGGITYQAIQALEAGGGTKHLVPIAKALGVSPEWLQDGSGALPSPPSDGMSIDGHSAQRKTIDGDQLKVLGMAEGGPNGWNILNGETVQMIDRPHILKGVPGAYAVYVSGHSMEPRYYAGEILYVHPGRPVLPGHYVIVQKRGTGGDPPLAVVKRLIRRAGGQVILEQTNPKKTLSVPAGEVLSIHKVVGSTDA